jgi:pimeloyl-ACP methyl ester carboxylesterase
MTDLHYSIAGKGTPIVLAHGFALDSRMWDEQVPELATRYSVIRYDLRGFGQSGMRDEPYSHAEDLKGLVDRLGLGRVALMGLSLGGGAVINFTIAYPDAVRALVVVDPSLGGFAWSAEMTGSLRDVQATTRERGVDAARDQWLAHPLFAHALANPRSAGAIRDMVSAYSGWHWKNRDPGRPFNPPAIQRLGEIRVPTLIIVGALDTPDFQAIATTLERGIPGATKVTLPGVGHLANLEAPERFNEVVMEFLSRCE